jgi:predicted  nucleic acid-binding Zn-ribbon protein
MTAKQLINAQPGNAAGPQKRHEILLDQVSHMVTDVSQNLVQQLDEIHRVNHDTKYQLRSTRTEHEALRAHQQKLEQEFQFVTQQAKSQQSQLEMAKEQIKMKEDYITTIAADAKHFNEHHTKIVATYQAQDEKHFKDIQVGLIDTLIWQTYVNIS